MRKSYASEANVHSIQAGLYQLLLEIKTYVFISIDMYKGTSVCCNLTQEREREGQEREREREREYNSKWPLLLSLSPAPFLPHTSQIKQVRGNRFKFTCK